MSIESPLRPAETGVVALRRRALELSGVRNRAGELALGGLVITVAAVVLGAARTYTLLPESVRPVPSWLAGAFAAVSFHLATVALVLVLGAMFACYAVAVRCSERLSPRAVLGVIATLHALVLLGPPLLSTDLFNYQAYARIFAVYGGNPYLQGPHAIALDAVYPFIGAKWVTTPSDYGPLFTALSAALAPLSVGSAVVAYKSLAMLASLAMVALIWDCARLRGLDRVKAVALVGLNPLVVVYGVGGAHNDLPMLAAMMAGVWLILRRRERLGGGAMVVAAAVKLTGGLMAPFAVAGFSAEREQRRRRDFLVGVGAAAGAVAAVTFGLFGSGSLNLIPTLEKTQSEGDWHSIPGFISTRLGLGSIGHVTGVVLGLVCMALLVWLLRRTWRGEIDWIDASAWAVAALVASASSLLPWYAAWVVPVAALSTQRRLLRLAIIVTGVVMFIQVIGYFPHGASFTL